MNIFNKKRQRGFTLIEMMVSIFIFLLVMTAIVQIFAQQIRAYGRSRTVQGDLENAQFAMNYIAKTARTASVLGSLTSGSSYDREDFLNDDGGNDFYARQITNTSESLIMYDFSQDRCLKFTFRDSGCGGTGSYTEPSLCMGRSPDDPTDGNFVPFNQIERCLDVDVYDTNEKRLTTGNVDGSFSFSSTRFEDEFLSGARVTDAIGRVTVAMKVLPEGMTEDDVVPVYMQTTASLRDYPADLSF